MKNTLHYFLFTLCTFVLFSGSAQNANGQSEKPLYEAEQMPQYPGGDEALIDFIKTNLKYPASAAESGIEGRVYIRFVVDTKGQVTDATVIRSLNPACDAEALRVVNSMPLWTPGKRSGQVVSVYYTIPILYKLQKPTVNTNPLLVVDGRPMPYTMLKDTTQLNPSKIERITVLRDSAAVAIYGQAGKNGVVLVETKVAANRKDSLAKANKPQYGVEVMPVFPGGDEGLMAFIRKNLHYPSSEAFRNIEGRTTIRFVISKTGKVTDITVVRSLSPGCDAEAVRVVRMMPDWKPGTQKGVPVDVYYTLPVVFRMVR